MLLQSQRKVQQLRVSVDNDTASLDDGHVPFCDSQTWMKPLIKQVKELATFASTSENMTAKSFRYYQFLLENIPSLQALSIAGYHEPDVPCTSRTWMDLRIILQKGLTTSRFASVTALRLKRVDLEKSSETLFNNVQFSVISKLVLVDCNNMATFMNALLEYYKKNEGGFANLSISLPWRLSNPDTDIQAIERFLKGGPKVMNL
jgi:hypothetical protein